MLSVGQQSLLGYLPAIIIQNILDGKIDLAGELPQYYTMNTVSLFADISGFTKLSEAFSKKGRVGPEFLAYSLNRYMEQLRKNGGDIFKFAGDAILVIWPENNDNIIESCRRAIQCALDIQSKLNNQEITPNKRLSVKIGIGVGECTILVVGGLYKRCECLCVGEALRQACESETKATEGGQTICSEDVKKNVEKYFSMEEAQNNDGHGNTHEDMKYYKILNSNGERTKIKADAFLMRTKFNSNDLRQKVSILKTLVPGAICLYLDIEKEIWSKEIRLLTIMFLNLKVDLSQTKNKQGMARIQEIVKTVQRSIYLTQGGLNKFLMDDKGSVMLICWGLPPISSPDDHVKSIVSALILIEELKKINCGAYMGVTTGTCFTGVCGTLGNRREYSLLGEVVNLSARFMGKAMKHGAYNKLDHLVLLDDKTKNLIQNKIRCEYVCSDECKGFSGIFNFYRPTDEKKFTSKEFDPFPFIRTHQNNPISYQLAPNDKSNASIMHNKSLFISGRDQEVNSCVDILNEVYQNKRKEIIILRGVTGSGKSLFIRRFLHNFINGQKDLKEIFIGTFNNTNKLRIPTSFIFTSFQSPFTFNTPFNGFEKIFKEIYLILKSSYPSEFELIKYKKVEYKCDNIGKILFKKDIIQYVKYIEEILGFNLSIHYIVEDGVNNLENILVIPKRSDILFENRNYEDSIQIGVCKFFKSMIKLFKRNLNKKSENLFYPIPLILVLEDSQHFDDISINFINIIRHSQNKNIPSICLIISYQDPLFSILNNPKDKMSKMINELTSNINNKNISIFIMENIHDINDLQELIKHHLSDKILEVYKTTIDRIDPVILNIIMAKSFNGVPLFALDIIDNLINSKKYVQILSGELIVTSELMDMEEMRDWTNFTIPMRIEKILGTIIDTFKPKEIIILKYASVIGNIFDIVKLHLYIPFNNISLDELNSILKKLEQHEIIEILYDLNPKFMVYKFRIPFIREILYQRMLIEQKNEIHLNMARSLQNTNFKYMPHNQEVKFLEHHLKTIEKTLNKHMEDEPDDEVSIGVVYIKNKNNELNLNNLKIFLVKDICERLKIIDLKLEHQEEEEDNYHNNHNNKINKFSDSSIKKKKEHNKINVQLAIKSGYIEKKSDKNITWEYRFVVITNTKVFYFYHEKEFLENKMPLGSFLLKNLFDVEILNDYFIGGKNNLFSIQVSSWTKKNLTKHQRRFFFSTKNREELYQWVITLNFLRVKATYDEFSSQFGLINLPLRHEVKKFTKKTKQKFTGCNLNSELVSSNSGTFANHDSSTLNLYNYVARKSVSYSKNIKNSSYSENNRSVYNSFIRRSSMSLNKNYKESNDESNDKLKKLKNMINETFFKSFVIILGFIQDVIFNADNININEDKVISEPKFLKGFLENNENEDDESKVEDQYFFSEKQNKMEILDKIKNNLYSESEDKKLSENFNNTPQDKFSKPKLQTISFSNEEKINSKKNEKLNSESRSNEGYKNKINENDKDYLISNEEEDDDDDDDDFLDLDENRFNKEKKKTKVSKRNNKNDIIANILPTTNSRTNTKDDKITNTNDEKRIISNSNILNNFNIEYESENKYDYSAVDTFSNIKNISDREKIQKQETISYINKSNLSDSNNNLKNSISNSINNKTNHPGINNSNLGRIIKINTINNKETPESDLKKYNLSTKQVDLKKSESCNSTKRDFNSAGTDPYSTVLNKLKNLNVSITESEDDLIIDSTEINNMYKADLESNDDNESIINFCSNKEEKKRKSSFIPKYTDPKYDFLKKVNKNLNKNVHTSNLFKNILKK